MVATTSKYLKYFGILSVTRNLNPYRDIKNWCKMNRTCDL